MAIPLDLYTVGNIETLSQVYKYLVLILGDNFIGTVIKITAVWGLLFAILASAFKGRFSIWIYHFLMTYFLFQIFFMPIVRLTIIDTKLDKTYVVDKVPFGVGFIASMASSFSYKLTNLIDNAFHTGTIIVWGAGTGSYPAYIDFNKTGYAGVFTYMQKALKIKMAELAQAKPEAIKAMNAYIPQCFFPYVSSLNATELENLRKTKDLLSKLSVDMSLLMSFEGQTYTCDEFYTNVLLPRWNNLRIDIENDPHLIGIPEYAKDRITDAVNAMTADTQAFNQIITQSGIINLMKSNYVRYGTADENLNSLLASYAVGRAEEQANLIGRAMFLWASKVVPFMQNFLEAFFVIMFPFLIILLFIPLISFGGVQPAIGYLKVIVWVYLFIPILAIMDGMIKLSAINKTIAWLNATGMSGLTLGDYGFLLEQADFFPAIAGFASLSTPLWAWMLLKGFEAGVHGISALVGSMGSQFVGQEAGAATITRNMTRDSKELMAGMSAGQSPVEALSNAGTWMYKENTNLGGLYSSLGSYDAHSILESQLGINGAVQTTKFGALYGLTHSGGRGRSAWFASGGSVEAMMNTAAMTSPSRIIETDYGYIAETRNAKGELVGYSIHSSVSSDMLQANLQTSISQSKTDMISTAWNSVWGNSQTYQKAVQSTSAITEQFLEDYTSGTGIDDRASFDNRAEVKKAFTDAQELRDTLSEEYGLSKDKATQFVAEFTTGLNAAAAKNGGKLDIETIKDVFKSVLGKFKADMGVGAKGIENFEETQAWKEATQYADNKSYQYVQDTALSYTTSHSAYFNRVKQEKGAELQDVSYQDLQQFNENWQKAEQITAQINQAFNQTQTQLGSLNTNNLVGFIRWLNGGQVDKEKEELMMHRIHSALANNDKVFLNKFTQAYTAYTMEMQGMNDIHSSTSQFLAQTQWEFLNMVEGKVDNAQKNVITHFANEYQGVQKLREMHNVNPYQDLYTEAGNRFAYVGSKQAEVESGVAAGKGKIKEIDPPKWTGEVKQYTKDPTSPVELGKNMINYGREHTGWRYAVAGGTLASVAGTAIEYAPWAKGVMEKGVGLVKNAWTTFKNIEPVAEMGTGRWAQFAAGGRLLTLPVGSVAGASLAVATVPLAAAGGWAVGTAINNKWGDDIYKNFTEPVLDWIGEKTGLWKPVGGNK